MTRFSKLFLPFFLFFGFCALYIHNLSRGVYGGDVGDLVTASFVRGVAHPPGYPLFTFLGNILSHIPNLASPAFGVGLISAVSAAAGVSLFYVIQMRFTKNVAISVLGSLILGFSFFYWFYSEIAEVFALCSFFSILLFLFALLFKQTKKQIYLYALVFTGAISLTNQQTIILVFPSLFLLIASELYTVVKKRKSILLWMGLFGLLGMMPYLYIPYAASFHPVVNWDNVHDVSSFLRLFLRQDYGTLQAGIFETPSFLQRIVSINIYLVTLIAQVTIPVVVISLLGLWELLKKDKVVFWAIAVGWVLSGPVFIAYAGFPLTSSFILGVAERFFLLSSVVILIPFGLGLSFLIQKLVSFLPQRKYYSVLFQSFFFLIPLLLFVYNFPKTNLSTVMIGDLYAKDLLTVLPPNAVLVISGDSLVFNTWYVHFVQNVRPDITLYNIGGGVTSPYILQKQQSQKGKQADKLANTLLDIDRTRPVFSTILVQPSSGKKITWVPFGLSYAMVAPGEGIPTKELYLTKTNNIWSNMHVPTSDQLAQKAYHNLTITEFPASYANAYIATGTFFYSHYQDHQTALAFYQKARLLAPDNVKAYETLGAFYLGENGKCRDVVSNFSQAISLDPFEKLPYFLLYHAYTSCAKSQTLAHSVKLEFERVFQKDFAAELRTSLTSESELLQ